MKKIISLIITSLLLISCPFICACGNSNNEKAGITVKTMTDFENVYEIMSLKVTAAESQLALNEDKNYVSSGERSLKMTFNTK